MKKVLPIVALVITSLAAHTQTVLYNQNFNDVAAPDLPGGWSATSDQVFTNASSPSGGYAGASGGNNLLSRNCNPTGEVRSFQVDGISSANFAELNVSFGHRRTNAFTPPVTLEWSSDGASWNAIAYNSGSAGTSWTLFTSATLPSGADDQANLSFRWTYTTNVGNVPCDNFAGNYRIDDFKVTAAAVLPVELLDFACFPENKSVALHWRTATERASDFFAIERSADGRTFAEIARIKGAGASTEPTDYTFTDESPLSGRNYYRLRQVDFDGRYAYSKVLNVHTGQPAGVRLFPSPATGVLNVHWEIPVAEPTAWEICDLAGVRVHAGEFPTEDIDYQINVNELPAGTYTLRAIAGREVSVQLFQKCH